MIPGVPVPEVPARVLPGGAVCRRAHEKHRSEIRDRVSTPVGICRTGRSVGVCVHVCARHRERARVQVKPEGCQQDVCAGL